MFDTHCHLTSKAIEPRVSQVLTAARQAGVDNMITVGITPDDSIRAAALVAEQSAEPIVPGVNLYATAGIHPHEAARYKNDAAALEAIRQTLRKPGIVAIGEMGLDCHYPEPSVDDQKVLFEAQLALSGESEFAHLPIVIHNREATGETLAMIRTSGLPGERFVFHCYTGDENEIEPILAIGAVVSFTGIVTFRNASSIAAASDRVPDDRLLIETDSPYLTPEPHRKVRPNEPKYVVHVAEFLAERRGMNVESFVKQVDANARQFFRITQG